ncbi:hypothetical protein K439DRAFT_1529201 [Ramaria rubella]|nr:hypothetical protein K439DRAFT_1529201 [Ramaria rubella]
MFNGDPQERRPPHYHTVSVLTQVNTWTTTTSSYDNEQDDVSLPQTGAGFGLHEAQSNYRFPGLIDDLGYILCVEGTAATLSSAISPLIARLSFEVEAASLAGINPDRTEVSSVSVSAASPAGKIPGERMERTIANTTELFPNPIWPRKIERVVETEKSEYMAFWGFSSFDFVLALINPKSASRDRRGAINRVWGFGSAAGVGASWKYVGLAFVE